jgi:hypothetical protein
VQIDNKKVGNNVRIVANSHKVLERAQVVADMQFAGRPYAADNDLFVHKEIIT